MNTKQLNQKQNLQLTFPKQAKKLISHKQLFQQILTCHICYCHQFENQDQQIMMCPHCSKIYCQNCIKRCLQIKPECPNCRKNIKGFSYLANCSRFINQIKNLFGNIFKQKQQKSLCSIHQIQLKYFCLQCQIPICCQCNMFGQHQKHQIISISKKYEQRYKTIRNLLSELKMQIKLKEQMCNELLTKKNQIKFLKQFQTKNITKINAKFKQLIQKQMKQKQINNQTQFQKIKEIQEQLKKKQNDIQQIKIKGSKYKLYYLDTFEKLESQITQRLYQLSQIYKKISNKSAEHQNQFNILNEIIPQYITHSYILKQFSLKQRKSELVYSDIKYIYGCNWRLKIYPNGNQSVKNSYFSIFLQMVSTDNQPNNNHQKDIYQFQIQLIHQNKLQNKQENKKRYIREYRSNFQVGQCWGYNKFIKLENLYTEGFIIPERDQIQVKYSMRNISYFNVYMNQLKIVQQKNKIIEQEEKQIQQLEKLIQIKK